jgi:pimeloyl-ACP methyl ester carboxylesterase
MRFDPAILANLGTSYSVQNPPIRCLRVLLEYVRKHHLTSRLDLLPTQGLKSTISNMFSKLFSIALLAYPVYPTPVPAFAAEERSIKWGKCDPVFRWFRADNIQCGNLTVPIDWDIPDGKTLELGMVRVLRSSNSTAKRIGNLFINPGGPGASASYYVASIAGSPKAAELLNSYDIVGIDPRGVGLSAPIQCDADIYNERATLFPKTREDYNRLVDKNRRLGESCLEMSGDLVNHLDTISVAKDHEAVRATFGADEKFNWLGLSYGSQIGAQYAQLFPDKIGAMVLDGVLQHSQSEASNLLVEGTAYEAGLKAYFKWSRDTSSPEGEDVEEAWYNLLKQAKEAPIDVDMCGYPNSCRLKLNEEDIRFNAQGLILTPNKTASSLEMALNLLPHLLSTQLAKKPIEVGYEIPVIYLMSSYYGAVAVGCQDWAPELSTFEDFQAKMRIGQAYLPLTQGASQSWTLQASCVGWPTPVTNPPAKLNVDTGDNPILMVSGTIDPSTSYVWGVGMQQEIKSNVFLTRKGEGHTSWSLGGATAKAINRFLLTKELPAVGTVLES